MILINEDIKMLRDEVIQIRHDLHQIPELGFEEYKTSKYIVDYLKKLDFKVYDKVAKTGVIGYLRGSEGKNTIAFRADMDALPVSEKTGLPFCSKHDGKMHACGHDGHMAILLGFAKYIFINKEKIKDNILLIFQPAEEGPGGAEVMVKEGILERFNVDRIYGLHLYPDVEEGIVAVRPGAMMAQTGEFDIYITGKSGHGAIPQNSIDSIVIGADLISSFQSIVSRNISPIEPVVLTIGKIKGGERRNVIAGKLYMEGTLRAFNESVYKKVKNKMISFAKGLEISYGSKIEIVFRDMYPPVNNNEKLVENFIEIVGYENLKIIEPQMTAEDFSYYQKKIPGLFFFLGVKNQEKGHTFPLHNSKFNFNDEILITGIQIYADLLNENDGLDI